MATTFKYASQSDLKNYFNNFGDFDQKVQLYNFVKNTDDFVSGADLYYATNTGFVNQLFINGTETYKITFPTTQTTLLNGAMSDGAVGATVDSSSGIEAGDIIKIDNQYMKISGVTDGTTIAFTGGSGATTMFQTQSVDHIDNSKLYLVVDSSEHDAVEHYWFVYDSDMDMVILSVPADTDPNDSVVESGVDFSTFIDQQLVNASMELNNLLDARFQMPLPKSTQILESASSGLTPEYDPIIIKATCYICAANLIRSKDPMSEEAQFYMDMVTNVDGTGIVDKLNEGKTKLSFEIDNKDSQGSIREITRTGSMYLVETAGEFYGGNNGYDLLRITCTTAGAYGTAKCKVEYYGNDKLFGQEETDNIVTGTLDNWSGLSGIEVRFQGSSMAEDDQWEIEVYHEQMEETNSVTRNISLHR